MKKIVTLIIVLAILSLILLFCNQYPIYVGTFSLDDYQEEMELFPYPRAMGEIETSHEAVVHAKAIWKEEFSDSFYGFPYYAYYDAKNEAWLVHPSVMVFFESGPYIIFSQRDGQVLALWGVKF